MNVLDVVGICFLTLISLAFGFAFALPRFKKVKIPWDTLAYCALSFYPFATAFLAKGSPNLPFTVGDVAGMVVAGLCFIMVATFFAFIFWWIVLACMKYVAIVWSVCPDRPLKARS